MNYGTEQGDFLGQEKLILGHNEVNYRTEQGNFLGQEKLTYIYNETNVIFWDRRSQFWVLTR